jgi:hypothetical protein
MDCFWSTLKHEGVYGLYRGMAAPLVGTVFETSTLFFINGRLKRMLSEQGHLKPGEELPMPLVWVAGAGTGFFVSFVLTPIELVKCRLQVCTAPGSAESMYSGPMDCIRKSVAAEGVGVMYRGHFGTMLREIPGTAAWFAAYEWFARRMTPEGCSREDLPASTIITAGALGGVAYWVIMYPADTIKALQQIADSAPPPGPEQQAAAAAKLQAAQQSGAVAGASGGHGSGGVPGGPSGVIPGGGAHATGAAPAGSASLASSPAQVLRQAMRVGMASQGSAGLMSAVVATGSAELASVEQSSLGQCTQHRVESAGRTHSRLAGASAAAASRPGVSPALSAGCLPSMQRSPSAVGAMPQPRAAAGAGALAAPMSTLSSALQTVTHHAKAAVAALRAPSGPVPEVTLTGGPLSFGEVFRQVYKSAGVRGLYAGFLPTILRAAPSNAAIFVVYEMVNSRLKQLL